MNEISITDCHLRRETMKYLFSILLVLLVLTAGPGGYFIYQLNNELEDARISVSESLDELDKSFRIDMEHHNASISASIEENKQAFDEQASEHTTKLNNIDWNIKSASDYFDALSQRHDSIEETLKQAVLDTGSIYETIKKSVIMISDGEELYGSGFIISHTSGNGTPAENVFVTAYHVVEDIDEIYVTLFDGRTWKADIRAFSKDSDTAFLQLKGTDACPLPDPASLYAANLNDSGQVKTGDPLVVIGSPLDEGLKGTMTSGIVSQVNRCITIDDKLHANLIQLDAAANYGNSGGPVFNTSNEVIGMIIARISPQIGDGINYAISSNQIEKIIKAIGNTTGINHEYKGPWTGITVEEFTPADIAANDNTVFSGAKVTKVEDPGRSAGINTGNVILKINDRPVTNCDDFYSILAELFSPGDSITIEKFSSNTTSTITLKLGEK
jgi:S1-C subfamily serine protease